MKIKPYREDIDPTILMKIRTKMRNFFSADVIQDTQSFEEYMKPWDDSDPRNDLLIAEDDNGNIVGWSGLFKSTKFYSCIAILVLPEYVSSDLPIKLLDSTEKLAKAQDLNNLRLYVYGTFTVLRNGLTAQGIQFESADFTLMLKKPESTPSITIPNGISFTNSKKAERLVLIAALQKDE